jgi:hypothetical protein
VVVLGFDLTEEVLARDYDCVGTAVVERKDQQRPLGASCDDVATGWLECCCCSFEVKGGTQRVEKNKKG